MRDPLSDLIEIKNKYYLYTTPTREDLLENKKLNPTEYLEKLADLENQVISALLIWGQDCRLQEAELSKEVWQLLSELLMHLSPEARQRWYKEIGNPMILSRHAPELYKSIQQFNAKLKSKSPQNFRKRIIVYSIIGIGIGIIGLGIFFNNSFLQLAGSLMTTGSIGFIYLSQS
ncbi:MAG: hypothetical protein EBS07_06325 [Sphingobacteriia bacterium]|nr:hypothetical protein [Sphingobacteriia bacterium]